MPSHIRAKIAALPPEIAFNDPDAVKRILAEDAMCESVFTGESCIFPDMPTPNQYPDVVQLDKTSTAFAVLVSGQIVATCASVRENDACAEAYVYTELEFRRRGYGAQVTAAWARHIMVQGKVPFYSYAGDNAASLGLARRLHLIPYAAVVVYD